MEILLSEMKVAAARPVNTITIEIQQRQVYFIGSSVTSKNSVLC